MLKKLRKNKKGFTLAELLIVVAIIGVLVAISIPIFTAQLEKAREATDAANIRAAYAQVMSDALTDTAATAASGEGVTRTGDKDGAYVWTANVPLKQQQDNWQSAVGDIGGIDMANNATKPKAGGSCDVVYTQSTAAVTITFK